MSPNFLKVALCLTAIASQAVKATPLLPRQAEDADVPTVTGVNLELPTNAFGSSIEGAAVNANGDVFAADFRGGGQEPSSAYAVFFQIEGGTANILDEAVNPIFVASPDGVANPPLLAGARFKKGDQLLLTDATNKRVLSVRRPGEENQRVSTFCSDPGMLQPNDLALAPSCGRTIYLSGQNFTADTTAGVSGDLWTCKGRRATKFPAELLKEADIHRTNGIETSPDGQTLYLSSATNVGGTVVANRIFKFKVEGKGGKIVEEVPELFYDFTGEGAATDVDGMRTDTDGNLFVTRNGEGRIFKISPEGKLLQIFELPGMGGPSNLEFGGPNGKTLFAVGRCAADTNVGCAASVETDSVGKAFASLQ